MTTTPAENKIMIEMIKVSKEYPPTTKALSEISLSIKSGEMCFLIGKSGAGKTTLLKLLCNMEKPTHGLIEVAGKQVNDLRGSTLAKLRQKIGVAYQDFKLLNQRTTAENIAVAMQVSYKKPSLIRQRVVKLLEQLDLTDKHNTLTGELSRGEQQRVALARAIANSPTIILVDEPTGNLDAVTTEKVMTVLENCQKAGATILIATHDETIFKGRTNRVLELKNGFLVNDNLPNNVVLDSIAYGSPGRRKSGSENHPPKAHKKQMEQLSSSSNSDNDPTALEEAKSEIMGDEI